MYYYYPHSTDQSSDWNGSTIYSITFPVALYVHYSMLLIPSKYWPSTDWKGESIVLPAPWHFMYTTQCYYYPQSTDHYLIGVAAESTVFPFLWHFMCTTQCYYYPHSMTIIWLEWQQSLYYFLPCGTLCALLNVINTLKVLTNHLIEEAAESLVLPILWHLMFHYSMLFLSLRYWPSTDWKG